MLPEFPGIIRYTTKVWPLERIHAAVGGGASASISIHAHSKGRELFGRQPGFEGYPQVDFKRINVPALTSSMLRASLLRRRLPLSSLRLIDR